MKFSVELRTLPNGRGNSMSPHLLKLMKTYQSNEFPPEKLIAGLSPGT